MQNRWETEILQHEAPKTSTLGRTRDRWGTSNDTQIPSADTNRLPTFPQGKENFSLKQIFILIKFIF